MLAQCELFTQCSMQSVILLSHPERYAEMTAEVC
jgi:hypothetical protein